MVGAYCVFTSQELGAVWADTIELYCDVVVIDRYAVVYIIANVLNGGNAAGHYAVRAYIYTISLIIDTAYKNNMHGEECYKLVEELEFNILKYNTGNMRGYIFNFTYVLKYVLRIHEITRLINYAFQNIVLFYIRMLSDCH